MTVQTAVSQDVEDWMALVELVRAHFPGLDLPAYRVQLEAAIGREETLVARDGDPLGVEARALYRRFGFVSREKIEVFDYPCEVLEYRVPEGCFNRGQ